MREIQRIRIFRGTGNGGFRSLRALAPAFALALLCGAPARAAGPITFAQYFETGGTQQWSMSESSATGPTTITASGTVFFLFSNTPTAYNGDVELADFTFTATSNITGDCGVACANGDSYAQEGYNGSFSFTDVGGPLNGVVLLGGTFSTASGQNGATFSSNIGSSQAGIGDSATAAAPTQLTFSSGVPGLDFSTQVELDAAWSLSSFNPSFAVGTVTSGTAYPSGTYSAAGTGTFATQPGFLPEPGTLPMTLIGIGLCGIAFLSRRLRSKVTPRSQQSS